MKIYFSDCPHLRNQLLTSLKKFPTNPFPPERLLYSHVTYIGTVPGRGGRRRGRIGPAGIEGDLGSTGQLRLPIILPVEPYEHHGVGDEGAPLGDVLPDEEGQQLGVPGRHHGRLGEGLGEEVGRGAGLVGGHGPDVEGAAVAEGPGGEEGVEGAEAEEGGGVEEGIEVGFVDGEGGETWGGEEGEGGAVGEGGGGGGGGGEGVNGEG